MSNFPNETFKKFASDWGFQHKTTHPQYPNLMVWQKVKSQLNEASVTKTNSYLALLNYRNMVIIDAKSSSQLLSGRKLRTNQLVQPEQLNPATQTYVQRGRRQKQQRQILQQTCQTTSFIVVWNDNKKVWKPATVIHQCDMRSYIFEYLTVFVIVGIDNILNPCLLNQN